MPHVRFDMGFVFTYPTFVRHTTRFQTAADVSIKTRVWSQSQIAEPAAFRWNGVSSDFLCRVSSRGGGTVWAVRWIEIKINMLYCRTGFNSDSLTAAKIATKMIAIIEFRHYTLYGSCPPIYRIAIIRSLLFLFLARFHESANICVAIKSGSTVCSTVFPRLQDTCLRKWGIPSTTRHVSKEVR